MTGLEVASGPLSVTEIGPTLGRGAERVGFCARRMRPEPQGVTFEVQLVIRAGRASVEGVEASAPLGKSFAECVGHRVASLAFPWRLRSTEVQVALRIDPVIAVAPPAPAPPLSLREELSALATSGHIYEIDPFVLASLRQTDPCAEIDGEIARLRCQQVAEAELDRAAGQLSEGVVLIDDVMAEIGRYDPDAQTFSVVVPPLLVPGGLGSAGYPGLTLGRLEVDERGEEVGFALVGSGGLALQTRALSLDDAERLAEGQLRGVALVRLVEAYEDRVRTGFWYLEQNDPDEWTRRLGAGQAREADRWVSLYNVSAEPMALELVDPTTGDVVVSWRAATFGGP